MDQVFGPGVPVRSVSSDGFAHVFFDGNTSISTNSDFIDANYTIFTVSAQSGNQNARLISSTTRNWALGYYGGKFDSFYFDGWVKSGNSDSDTQIHFHVASVNDSDQSNCWVDFSQVATDSAGANNSFYFPGKLSLGGRGSGERSIGKVAEVIYFSRVLQAAERLKIEGYLAHKWGSSARLPNEHPYKNSPPTFEVVEENATVSGTVYYDGVIPGPAYVWALEANGSKAAEVILPDGNGSYTLMLRRGGHTISNPLWMVREMVTHRDMRSGNTSETGTTHPKNSILSKLMVTLRGLILIFGMVIMIRMGL